MKHEKIERLQKLGFVKEAQLVQAGHCPSCGEKIDPAEFRTATDKAEHRISGLCQDCMDAVFGKE